MSVSGHVGHVLVTLEHAAHTVFHVTLVKIVLFITDSVEISCNEAVAREREKLKACHLSV